MRSNFTLRTLSLAALSGSLALTGAVSAQAATKNSSRPAPQPIGRFERAPGGLLSHRNDVQNSANWAGYAVHPGHGITAVHTAFTVPRAGLVPPGFAATWTGIGGYTTNDLIQAGVSEASLPSLPVVGQQYYPWYELLPDQSQQLTNCSGDSSCAVSPGQHVSVNINRTGANRWKISLSDAGHWSWTRTFSYRSSGSAAEWILEAPIVTEQMALAPVGNVGFTNSTYSMNGRTRTIAQGHPTNIGMSLLPGNLGVEATTSALHRDGKSFDVCSYRSTCS